MYPTFTVDGGILERSEFIKKLLEYDFPTIKTNKKVIYYNIPAAFDIETSSFYQNGEKKACMYVWQFGIYNWVTVGRTWNEFLVLLKILRKVLDLNENRRLIVYIHNFSYEFQFMRKWFEWDKLFFLEERKPVYGLVDGIEFRCSLKLSSKSLARVGADLQKYHVEKKVGDLDYSLIRTSETPLSSTELGYCENDIRVLLAYIQEKIETDGNISRIPLTNTGYVRQYCKKACFKKFKLYKGLMSVLTLEPDEYEQLKRGFSGGFTHACAKYAGKILSDVGSFDFTSSYPAVMLAEQFPMSKGILVNEITSEQLDYYLHNYCCLMDIKFTNLRAKLHYDHPISESRLISKVNYTTDNGRIVTADEITLTCTEQDLYVYGEFYDFDSMEILKMRVYEKGYLPKPFVQAILDLYKKKTMLKGVDGEEINYMISKNMLNSAYGMAVTDIVRDEISYVDDDFSVTKPDLNEAIKKYNNSGNRFLFYPWGVWVTAYARANLFSGIIACGNDYVYSDTDSIKILNPENHMDYIERYNEDILAKLKAAAEFHHLDFAEFSPLNKKGEPKPIGVWDYEGTYDRFKTIGAKRYMCQRGSDISITIAGLNKQSAKEYICQHFKNPFDALADGLNVSKDFSGRLTLTYVDTCCSGMVEDYLGNLSEYEELSYIHMEPSDYTLTLSDSYKDFLRLIQGYKDISW